MSLAFPGGRHVASGTGAAPALSPQPGSAISPENRPRWHPEPRGGERQAIVTPRPERDPPSCPAHGETEARRGRALTEQPGRHRHRAPSARIAAPGGIWSPAAATRTRCQPWCVPPAEGSPSSTVPIPAPIAVPPRPFPQRSPAPGAAPGAGAAAIAIHSQLKISLPAERPPAPGGHPQSPTRTPGSPERPYLAGAVGARVPQQPRAPRDPGEPRAAAAATRERPERVSTRLPPPPPRWQLR